MKTLQEHFTTLEQARDLLELGVPVGSADCYRLQLSANKYTEPLYLTLPLDHRMTLNAIPCWSVGRLIEIVSICSVYLNIDEPIEFYKFDIPMLNIMYDLMNRQMDFSKLEEYL